MQINLTSNAPPAASFSGCICAGIHVRPLPTAIVPSNSSEGRTNHPRTVVCWRDPTFARLAVAFRSEWQACLFCSSLPASIAGALTLRSELQYRWLPLAARFNAKNDSNTAMAHREGTHARIVCL